MELAGDAARAARDWPAARAAAERAAELYLEEGRPQAAADAYVRAARALEEGAASAAGELYARALRWLEDAGKEGASADVYRAAAALAVRRERWAEAAATLARLAAAAGGAGARAAAAKASLGAVVVWLRAGDGAAAWATYQDALGVDAFRSSDEAFAADALVEAYRGADAAAAVPAAVKQHPAFLHVDNFIARLAKKLPEGGAEGAARVAAGLGGGGGAGGAAAAGESDEDLT
jgi:hypothetical protein